MSAAAFDPDVLYTPHELRKLAKLRRELAAENPAFARALRRMTTPQLEAMLAEMEEEALAELQRRPGFKNSPQLQHQARIYEHSLRTYAENELWAKYKYRRPSIPRRKSLIESTAAAPVGTNGLFVLEPFVHHPHTAGAAPPPKPELPKHPAAEVLSNEERDNVINLQDRLYGKCFHTRSAEDNGVW